MTKLEEDAFKLSRAFMEMECVQKYLCAKKEYEESKELADLKAKINEAKKGLRLLPFEKRPEAVKGIKKMQEEFDSRPLVLAYENLKEEVEREEKPLRDLFVL
jgi:cell fate (sporulation/competence/biofilm development) regulator YmcA (YheA/YmcA/DUF963 family)